MKSTIRGILKCIPYSQSENRGMQEVSAYHGESHLDQNKGKVMRGWLALRKVWFQGYALAWGLGDAENENILEKIAKLGDVGVGTASYVDFILEHVEFEDAKEHLGGDA